MVQTETDVIDLRTDVKTLPTREMLKAMCTAELGDSKVGEDPTVNRLEAMAAERMGTEAAVLMISGTMANQAAMMAHADRGGRYMIGHDAHIYFYEGGHSALSGLLPVMVPSHQGLIEPDDLRATIRRGPKAQFLCLENTHNRGGGRAIPLDRHTALCQIARENNMSIHVDGARIFNTEIATGTPASEYVKHVDSVMFCLSKSLCCPLGSILCGSKEFIAKATGAMRRLGGGMRQAGVIAGPGIYALEHMVSRLKEDHANAKRLARGLAGIPGLIVKQDIVETNMIGAWLESPDHSAVDWMDACKTQDVLVGAYGPERLRFVTHRHHNAEMVDEATERIRKAADTLTR
ncbi:MAG: aminotransferase class I/II-fold pyridoxal phosphate-dependent enzyme [Lentisphaerae bacterium]|jgi:threonine aldolase|nr:aminotransferase class I/II-fold pyridoxal phosphate-dependent enzyme [Lentisphaerota bacterium]MBT5611154.1 aminotransferase class I/II-fold pyridoxal phosphate-dependent enzyme [Lentisphaerota bacterium]MBT7054722.1 aminotransferase class I/II-fold pyridoxal phosphate-dependent enzyme [Lentisphaerota bacterium]MBT7841980.1 aminotransferase class I/II-fold pyridoxal phosphate-dependent enzyme [Lentisphaerota bacterium]